MTEGKRFLAKKDRFQSKVYSIQIWIRMVLIAFFNALPSRRNLAKDRITIPWWRKSNLSFSQKISPQEVWRKSNMDSKLNKVNWSVYAFVHC